MNDQKPFIPEFDYEPDESFRDRVSTIDEKGKRKWIYATQPRGRYYTWRKRLSYFYFLIFITLPFLSVDGHPLFLFNILERKFILFGQVFWPQDFFLFGLLMITGVVFIVLFTVVFGRLFCGWVCPQTFFMEMLFRRLEYWIEGSPAKQRQLKEAPWTWKKVRIKGFKWLVFYLLSFAVGNVFLAYIIGVDALWAIVRDNPLNHLGGLSAMLAFSGVFFFVFAWFREQVCIVVCPYGRLQGVMLDRNSIVVAYDYVRGEPREKIRKNQVPTGGDCIDCNLCVRVCPTGIDIRNGTQMECVSCTACIDACDEVMEKVNRPKGLIRHASEASIAEKKSFTLTPRVLAYSIVMILLLGLVTTLLVTREDYSATVIRVPGQLFQKREDGRISNLYNIKVINKTFKDAELTLRCSHPEVELFFVGNTGSIFLPGEKQSQATFFLVTNPETLKGRKTTFTLELISDDHVFQKIKIPFLGPVK